MRREIVCAACDVIAIRTGHRQYYCRACAKIIRRTKRLARVDRDKENARHRIAYASNPELAERRRKRWREWAKANKAHLREKRKLWAERNADKQAEYVKKRLNNKAYKIHASIRSGIYASLRGEKRGAWQKAVGYSMTDLMRHLERQFTHGMSWENYGKGPGLWHIDHIVPRKSFRVTKQGDAEFAACWALANLRPLWTEENLAKSAKRLHLL